MDILRVVAVKHVALLDIKTSLKTQCHADR